MPTLFAEIFFRNNYNASDIALILYENGELFNNSFAACKQIEGDVSLNSFHLSLCSFF